VEQVIQHILEVSVESVEAALAAERGGAHRIELCSNAREGGTTPSADLLRAVRERVQLPIFALIRPRAGNFFYSDGEFDAMQAEIDAAKRLHADGVVLGLLSAHGRVDVMRTRQLVERAMPLPVTFHRAFDDCTDLWASLEDVVTTGAARLLTSGEKRTAPEALEVLGNLVQLADNRIIVMPGSGLHAGNIREAVQKTGAREYHAGLSTVIARPADSIAAFEGEVNKLAITLRNCD
jgi:copper homeostasis protein